MAKKNKLQNIKAIQQMIDGTHKFQTKKSIGFSDAESAAKKAETHAVGDVWEETDPVTGLVTIVEQRDGFRIRKSKNSDALQQARDYIRSFPNCRKDTCTCLKPHTLDETMRKANGMCFDCTIEMEHELKKEGKYQEYAKAKVRANALSWLRDAEKDVEMLKKAYTEASKVVVNSDGLTEDIQAHMTAEEFEEKVQKGFNEYKKEFLQELDKRTKPNEND
jgi:hypothetical protein